jgi:hypothetical protein
MFKYGPISVVNISTAGILFVLTLFKFAEQLRSTYGETLRTIDLITRRVSTGILGMFLRDASFYMLW